MLIGVILPFGNHRPHPLPIQETRWTMPFKKDLKYAAEIGSAYGAYLTTYTSKSGQVRAYLFRKGNRVEAHVSFSTGFFASLACRRQVLGELPVATDSMSRTMTHHDARTKWKMTVIREQDFGIDQQRRR